MESFTLIVQFIVSIMAVLLLGFCFVLLIFLATKKKSKSLNEKAELKIEHLNKYWQTEKNKALHNILSHKEVKELNKKNKPEKHKDEIKPKLFVLEFNGDISASECDNLTSSINTLLNIATPKDEVLVKLESPGGFVHSYGLAASQLSRIKNDKLKLSICVDKVAASGGYLMACIADEIIAAPFAVLGSIGVITSMPNLNRLLKKNDVDYLEMTAGEYKRTVTMFGEITDKGVQKRQEELENIHKLFKHHVAGNRPKLEIDKIATGEFWLGTDALSLNLIDKIATSDEIIAEYLKKSNVYKISYEFKENWKAKLAKQFLGSLSKILTRSNFFSF